jgi:peptidoglycan/LPS O-acetylase OafA/YrhL
MTNWADDVSFAFWLNTPSLWVDWVLGAYLAEQFYHGRKVFRRRLLWASVFLVLFVATDLFKPTSVLSFTVASVLSAIAIEACLYTGELARRRWALLSTLGLCSYSVYLWHQPLMDLLYRHGHIERLPHGCLRFSVMLSLTLLILFPFGYLMYVTVENGSRMLGKIGRTSHFKPLAFTSTNESDPTLR